MTFMRAVLITVAFPFAIVGFIAGMAFVGLYAGFAFVGEIVRDM